MTRSVLCLLALASAAGCDGYTRLDGEVVDTNDAPVANVEVRLSEAAMPKFGQDSMTDELGEFYLGLTHAPYDTPLVVTASKYGYKPCRKEFMSSESRSFPSKIVLELDTQIPAAPE